MNAMDKTSDVVSARMSGNDQFARTSTNITMNETGNLYFDGSKIRSLNSLATRWRICEKSYQPRHHPVRASDALLRAMVAWRAGGRAPRRDGRQPPRSPPSRPTKGQGKANGSVRRPKRDHHTRPCYYNYILREGSSRGVKLKRPHARASLSPREIPRIQRAMLVRPHVLTSKKPGHKT